MWMTLPDAVWVFGTKGALCVLDLEGGGGEVAAVFTTSEMLERFYVAARPEGRGERLSLTITGEKDFLCSFSGITKAMRFSFSPGEIGAGSYRAVLKQEAGSGGGRVIISGKPVGLTGWQVLSRGYVGLLVISGVWAGAVRKSKNLRMQAMSFFIFNSLFLGFVLIFLYLLFHEGGHALGASLFGRFDWTRSDFWGIYGGPHSGIKQGVSVEPWKRAVESFAGPMFPTLMGWVLFLVWRLRRVKRMRSERAMLNLYFSAIVVMSIFPFAAILGYLPGIISDGDWRGFIENVPGPLWLVKSLLCGVLLLNGYILWHIGPELWRLWKMQKAKIESTLRQPTSKT